MKRFLLILMVSVISLPYAQAEDVEVRREKIIKDFISDYQAAYQAENLHYIKQFFSNDALILTESGEFRKAGAEIIPHSTKTRPYNTLIEDRTQYIERLEKYFNDNDHVSLGISNVLITQHQKYKDIYGVNFFQIWDDTGDVNIYENRMPGYIFIMVDFRNSEVEPVIRIRTWQPKANIKHPTDKYKLTDFTIITSR